MDQLPKPELTESLQTQQADKPRHNGNTFKSTPLVQHRLVAGKLIRTMDLNDYMLNSSASAPELSRAFAREMKSLKDALDLALTFSEGDVKTPPRELSSAEKERMALRQDENLLHMKLLQATQKLNRKHQKQLIPRDGQAMDYERHKVQIAGRFSTQTDLDYYPRKLEPREHAADKHRRRTMHTKYGNALAKSKCSLRGAF
ncbi:hypothetical protein V7S43_016093 [Phytophthora oleae]|uniref:Uncharacterized protein n=1 Tax=Phytophthora oleae TaxID=2107226 RepID=A0ABD3EYJ5_9STRA